MDREHAVYTMARSLDALGFGNWTHTVVTWLGLYDGFERRIPEQDDPAIRVRDLLARYVTQPRVDIGQIAVDLAQLEFLHHRAAWIDDTKRTRRTWMPLQQPWLDFCIHGEEGEDLRVWWSEKRWPVEEEVRHHLLSGYVRMNGLR